MFGVFSTLPLTSNTKIVPKLWAHFSCPVSCSALPLLLNTDPPLILSVDAQFRAWNGFCSPPRAPPIYWPHRPQWWSADHHKRCLSISPTTLEIEHSRSTFVLNFEDGGALPVSHLQGKEGCTLFVSFFHSDEVEGTPPRLAAK